MLQNAGLAPILGTVILLFILVRRYQRLQHVPGPFLARFTDLWRFQFQFRQPIRPKLIEWHRRYGPLVRIGPNTISVSDAKCVPQIYNFRGEYIKANSYHPLSMLADGKQVRTVFDTQDEEEIRQLKRVVGQAFSLGHLLKYEAVVDSTCDALVRYIRQQDVCNLFGAFEFFQLDFLMAFLFSESSGFLENKGTVKSMGRANSSRLRHWYKWQAMPRLNEIIFLNPIWGHWFGSPSAWLQPTRDRIDARQAGTTHGKDILQDCVDMAKKNPGMVDPEVMRKLAGSFISGGTDTTAALITMVLYSCMKDSRIRTRLLAELEQQKWAALPPAYNKVKDLPYLDAAIREALRLAPPIGVPMEREVPSSGDTLNGTFLPGGTTVGCLASLVHLDSETYGEDAAEFRPERWLEASDAQRVAMERSLLAWGGGSRVCLGKTVAEIEAKKVIPTMLLLFDMELDDPEAILPLELGVVGISYSEVMAVFKAREGVQF